MAKKTKIGPVAYVFWIGLILALILAIAGTAKATWATSAWLLFLLVIIGIVIGFIKWQTKDTQGLFITAIALVAVGLLGPNLGTIDTLIPYVGSFLMQFVTLIVYLIAPAVLVLALKHIWKYFTK